MGRAVTEIGQPRTGSADFDIQFGNGDGLPKLIVGTPGSEDGKRTDERYFSGQCQSGGCRCHILLGDAHLEKPLRISVLEQNRHGGFTQIGFQNDNILVVFSQRNECFAIGGP